MVLVWEAINRGRVASDPVLAMYRVALPRLYGYLLEDPSGSPIELFEPGVSFRNDVLAGPGGKQILVDDPSGNPIELFQPAAR